MTGSQDLFATRATSDTFEGDLERRLERSLLALAGARHGAATICPSDAARQVATELGVEWRDLMRPVRHVTEVLAERGQIEVLQHGRPVHPADARGPVRVRLRLPRIG
jgi:hypothetical protein